MTKWWEAVEPTTVEVSCGDERHRISWRRSKLVLDDHDLGAEESFAALGGEPALCLEVLQAWRAAVDDRQVLWFWDAPRNGDPDMAEMLGVVRNRQQRMVASHRRLVASGRGPASMGPGQAIPPEILDRMRTQMAVEHRRSLLSALPEDLRIRLGLAAIVRARRHQHDPGWFGLRAADLQTALSARVAPAVEASMRAWRGRLAGHDGVTIESWIASPGEAAGVCGLMDDAGGWAAAWVPLHWLVDVWARGVAVVDGCFVLEMCSRGAGDRLSVQATRWERRVAPASTPVVEPAVLVRVDGGWRLRWDG
jgi:hypothetical protein